MDPFERLRGAGRRVTDPVETFAQVVAERVVEIVIHALDINEIIRQIDLNAALDQVDINRLLDRVVVTELLDRVDVDRLLNQVDVNGLIERVDVDEIVRRVDVDGLINRVDVNGLMDRVDVDTLVGQTDLGNIIARSTSGFASQALDAVRAQAVTIDQRTDRVVWRMERRKDPRPQELADAPNGSRKAEAALLATTEALFDGGPPHDAASGAEPPPAAVPTHSAEPPHDSRPPHDTTRRSGAGPPYDADPPPAPRNDPHPHEDGSGIHGREAQSKTAHAPWISMHGYYAGGATRLAAWIIDAAACSGAFTLALAAISYAASVITGHAVTWDKGNILVAAAFVVWAFAYFAYPWSLSGKTLGMAVLGIRVVAKDGTAMGWRRAVVRTLALPLSFLLFGLGLTGIVFQRQNRALHDFIAGTAVVYAWDARAARIRFLARTSGAESGQVPASQ